jgi:SAM-dependent methyltransferase
MSAPHMGSRTEVIWHDVECGSYRADLPLWRGLATEAAGPVLELGCGTGRVALDLAGAGFEVMGVDLDPSLLDAVRHRADERRLAIELERADVRRLELGRRFALILAPMQLIHLLRGPAGRAALFSRIPAHLAPQGRLAVAVLDAEATRSAGAGRDLSALAPDVREVDGRVYSSLPIEVRAQDGALEVRRLRQVVGPNGGLTESIDVTAFDPLTPAELEREAVDVGLRLVERVEIAATDDHVGSTVAVLEKTG